MCPNLLTPHRETPASARLSAPKPEPRQEVLVTQTMTTMKVMIGGASALVVGLIVVLVWRKTSWISSGAAPSKVPRTPHAPPPTAKKADDDEMLTPSPKVATLFSPGPLFPPGSGGHAPKPNVPKPAIGAWADKKKTSELV